ncbi:MAG: CpaF family protein [Actinobacteria bacterium]|nr:CpaF family protein [Actinomycetota bacterium]
MTGDVAGRVHARLLAEAGSTAGPAPERVAALVREEAPLLTATAEAQLVAEVLAAVQGLGPLEPLVADPSVSDVLVNGRGDVWVEREGRLERTTVTLRPRSVEALIERIVAPLGLRADRSSPLVDARLPDGSRVHAVVPPLAVDGPCLTIRRFAARPLPLSAFATEAVAALLDAAVRARASIVVSGGTGAGKTTLLNALAASVPPGERIVTVEDAAELRLPQDHVVRLESRPANAEGAGRVTVRELVRNALRMRPDRIIVGECRGPEALDMLQAMNTGHEGSLTTCHANGPDDALRRLETMVLMAEVGLPLDAVREQLSSAVDLVVQVARRPGGGRRVIAVGEVLTGAPGPDGLRVRRLDVDPTPATPCRPRLAGALS